TGSNLPLGRGLGQQAATYHWAGTLGNRRQPTPGQGSRGLNGTLAVESGLSTAPTQLSRDIGFTGTHRAVHNPGGLCAQQGQLRTQVVSAHRGAVQNTSGRCTQQAQFRTQVVSAHNRDSSDNGWSVHTAGTVQDTGGQCAQQGQLRTQVVSAHNR
ncbi:unnamed protein product, partial [Staurois parvus]